MEIEIFNTEVRLDVFGFSGTAINKNYAGMAFKLMDSVWQTLKGSGLKSKGQNIWVYEANDKVFAGVELDGSITPDTGLEVMHLSLPKYGYYKHIGPYNLIGEASSNMRNELKERGFELVLPYIEIYGHWTNDETKLETELIMALR
jgi:effector-binding domain-containing protein